MYSISLTPKSDLLDFKFPEAPSFLNDFNFPPYDETLGKPLEPTIDPLLGHYVNQFVNSETILEHPQSPSLKRKRGRKPKIMTVEDKIKGTQRRLERNRIFARENRKRKKEYIASLEAEV